MLRWRPKLGERYYIINHRIENYCMWDDDPIDHYYWELGNCFRTKRESQQAAKLVKKTLMTYHAEHNKRIKEEK